MTALSYQEGRRREKSLSSPWKSVVKTVLHHPSGGCHAIPFIVKSTEAITLHQCLGKWVSVLGEMEKRVMFIHPPVAGDRASRLHPWQRGELLLQRWGWGRRDAFLFPLPDPYLTPYVKPGNCFKDPGAGLAVISITLVLRSHPQWSSSIAPSCVCWSLVVYLSSR